MRTFKVTLTEDELKAVISFNTSSLYDGYSVERSARIHDLTKRLNKTVDDNNNNTEADKQTESEQPKVEGWN